MEKIYLKPAHGKIIRDPVSLKLLSEAGELKTPSSYWTRRLLDKDVVETEPPKTKAQAKEDKAP